MRFIKSAAAGQLSRRGDRLLHRNHNNLFSSASSLASQFSQTDTNLKSLSQNPNPPVKNAVSVFQQALESGGSLTFAGNNLMATLVRSRNHELAFPIYREMVKTQTFINFVTLSGLLECFVHVGKIGFARGVLALMLKRGFSFSVYNVNILLKGFCKSGECGKAVGLMRIGLNWG